MNTLHNAHVKLMYKYIGALKIRDEIDHKLNILEQEKHRLLEARREITNRGGLNK